MSTILLPGLGRRIVEVLVHFRALIRLLNIVSVILVNADDHFEAGRMNMVMQRHAADGVRHRKLKSGWSSKSGAECEPTLHRNSWRCSFLVQRIHTITPYCAYPVPCKTRTEALGDNAISPRQVASCGCLVGRLIYSLRSCTVLLHRYIQPFIDEARTIPQHSIRLTPP